MADLTPRIRAQDYLASLKSRPAKKRMAKFGNKHSITEAGVRYDSKKERDHHEKLQASRLATNPAERVVDVERQVSFVLIPKQDGERAVRYVADFVVTYADGHVEVQDTKSPPTRRERAYVLKRKLMLAVHGIRIQEL